MQSMQSMQSKEQLQTLLASLIERHLLWICKSHVAYDRKVEVAGLVSVTIDSSPKPIPVKFSHTYQRPATDAETHSDAEPEHEADADADGETDGAAVSAEWDMEDALPQGNPESDAIMAMLDRRALQTLVRPQASGKPVGAQKRKSKYAECYKAPVKQRRSASDVQALDLSKRPGSDASESEAEWRMGREHAEPEGSEGETSAPYGDGSDVGREPQSGSEGVWREEAAQWGANDAPRGRRATSSPLSDEATDGAQLDRERGARASREAASSSGAPPRSNSVCSHASSEQRPGATNGLAPHMLAMHMGVPVPFLKPHLASCSSGTLDKTGETGVGAPPAPPSECHICHTQCDSLPALAAHYDDEHKYIICQYCGKSFSTRQNLRRHERLHTGQRPYVCTVCNQGFYRRDAMMSHMGRSHTDRPGAGYQCTVCRTPSTTYNDKFTFRNHMQKKHGVPDVIFCNECVLAFGDKQAYRDHKLQAHGEPAQTLLLHAAGLDNQGESALPDAADKLAELAHAKFAALQDARALLKAHGKMPFLQQDDEARTPTLLSMAAQNTQALVKHLADLSAGLGGPMGPHDMQRMPPPFCAPFPFPPVGPLFARAVPSPHSLQRSLGGLPLLGHGPDLPPLPPLPLPGLLNPALLEQLKLHPGLFDKLLADVKDKCLAAARDESGADLQPNNADDGADNNNDKLQLQLQAQAQAQAAKQSPVKRD